MAKFQHFSLTFSSLTPPIGKPLLFMLFTLIVTRLYRLYPSCCLSFIFAEMLFYMRLFFLCYFCYVYFTRNVFVCLHNCWIFGCTNSNNVNWATNERVSAHTEWCFGSFWNLWYYFWWISLLFNKERTNYILVLLAYWWYKARQRV